MRNIKSGILAAATVAAAGLALSACATENYVDEHVAAVNSRVDQTDARVAALSSRVDGVERTAQEGLQRANAANALAQTKADAKFVYSDTGEGTSVQFATNRWALSQDAEATLTAFAEKLKSENKNVYVQIVGHGDPRGSVMHNRELGAKRALQVQRFLADQGVPLNRLDVVSWGEEKVANPSDRSSEALQQSRRVDLVVVG